MFAFINAAVATVRRELFIHQMNKGCAQARSLIEHCAAEDWTDIGLGDVAADGSTIYNYVGRASATAKLVWGPYPAAAINIEQARRLLADKERVIALGGGCRR